MEGRVGKGGNGKFRFEYDGMRGRNMSGQVISSVL